MEVHKKQLLFAPVHKGAQWKKPAWLAERVFSTPALLIAGPASDTGRAHFLAIA